MKIIQFTVISLFAVLTACGGDKVINTSDDSADYQSARHLPPLKKTLSSTSSSVTGTDSSVFSEGSLVSDDNIQFSIVDANKQRKRLKIDTEYDSAWLNLLARLRNSAITIHSRNKEAARIEVGCGEIDDGVNSERSDGWLLSRRENVIYDYCVLQLSESNNTTLVAVQNRRGEEVSASDAMTLLQQIVR